MLCLRRCRLHIHKPDFPFSMLFPFGFFFHIHLPIQQQKKCTFNIYIMHCTTVYNISDGLLSLQNYYLFRNNYEKKILTIKIINAKIFVYFFLKNTHTPKMIFISASAIVDSAALA